MILSEISVKRPIFAIVLSILLLIFGVICFYRLTVRELPDISVPSISITTTYTGATPEVVESRVTKVIEDELSGISGVKKIVSTSRNGKSWINIEFNKNINMLDAISDARDAVSRASKNLPKDVDVPIVTRDNGEGDVVLWLNMSSNMMDRVGLSDFADRFVKKNLTLLDGVSQVELVGALEKVMFVHLEPSKMMALGVTVSDIISAIGYENIELPSGELRNNDMYFPVEIKRLYVNEQSFELLPIRHNGIDGTIRLRDVARVEIRAKNENSIYHRNGVSSIGIGVIPQSNANPLDVSLTVRNSIEDIRKSLPDGVNLEIDFDSTIFIRNSIDEVYETLMITAVLVIIVLYVFIGSWSTTLIPAITVPISIISAFIGAYLFGFSINLMTLLSLILAIGLVVDDAIVMVENISHHIKKGEGVLAACWNGSREVGFAIISTTLVLVMIFMPITFMQGITGAMFIEFALLLSLAVLFSGLIALTLSPALSSIILRSKEHSSTLATFTDKLFTRVENFYRNFLQKFLNNTWLIPSILILVLGLIFILYKVIPHQFVPKEDQGVVYIYASGQEGTSIFRMKRNMQVIEDRLLPYIDKKVVNSVSFSTPSLGQGNDQSGFVVIQLADWNKRDISSKDFIKEIKALLSDIPDIKLYVYEPGFKGSSRSPIRYVIKGSDYQLINDKTKELVKDATQNGIIVNADTNYTESTPEIEVTINIERSTGLGVSLVDVAKALKIYLGGTSHTSFVDNGEEYDVYLRADEERFTDVNAIRSLSIRADNGDMIPLSNIADFNLVVKAKRLPHYDRRKAITISAHPGPGQSLGSVLEWMDAWSAQNLDTDMSTAITGELKNFVEGESDMVVIVTLAIVIVYLTLSAQFESFVYPIIVMITIPLGVLGGLFGLWILNYSLNIYSQIGLLLLIGMVTKNGILIVEYINQLRKRNCEYKEAIIRASVRRLKPILMTSITAIIGALPLVMATGSGHESRQVIGAVIFYGMGISTIITLCLLPSFYFIIGRIGSIPGIREQKLKAELEQIENQSK